MLPLELTLRRGLLVVLMLVTTCRYFLASAWASRSLKNMPGARPPATPPSYLRAAATGGGAVLRASLRDAELVRLGRLLDFPDFQTFRLEPRPVEWNTAVVHCAAASAAAGENLRTSAD
jgi:hypothetical protein